MSTIYEYNGVEYEMNETDPAKAKAKILAHLGQAETPVAPVAQPIPNQSFIDRLPKGVPNWMQSKPGSGWDDLNNQVVTGQPMNPMAQLSPEQQTEAGPALTATGNVLNTVLRGGAGMAKGAVINPIAALSQVLGGETGRKFAEEAGKSYEQQRAAAGGEGFDWAQLFGSVVSPVNRLLPSQSLIAGGAVGAVLNPVEGQNLSAWDIAKGKAEQASIGAIGGGAMATLFPALKIGAKQLLDQGVELTSGQTFKGLGGTLAGSVDFITDMARKAVGKPVSADAVRKSFTYAAVNEALAPIQQFVSKASDDGFAMVNSGMNKFKTAYPKAFESVGTVAEDVPFKQSMDEVLTRARSEFTEPKLYDKFVKEIKTNIEGKFAGDAREITGEQLHQVKRYLQAKMKNLSKATEEDEVIKADLYKNIYDSFTDFTHRVDTSGIIKATDKAYANMLRITEAAKQSSKTSGNFGPDKLSTVSASMAPGLQGGQGVGPLQKFAKEATNIIGSESDNVLTMANLKNAGLLTGAGYSAFLNPLTAIPLGVTGTAVELSGALARKNPALYEKIREKIGVPAGNLFGNAYENINK